MTLSSTATKVAYSGDGSTTVFAVTFVFWNSGDLRVIHRDTSGTETVWTEGTHYTLAGGAGGAGTLTVRTAPTDYTPAVGETLTIKDAQPETQGDSLPLSGAFPSTVVEQRFDKTTRLVQIHSEQIARSILLPETASLSGLQIPEPGAGELLRYNPAGTSLETVKFGDLSLAVDTVLTTLATNDFLRWDNAQSAWVNIAPGATGLALFQDATDAAARTELGLGTAAVVNTGVGNGNVPVMDATGYPAADGRQITNVTAPLRGHIDGLILSNNATDALKDIDIGPGEATDDGQNVVMSLSSTLVKRLDASWAVGTNAGGLDGTETVPGTPDASTWYHCWLIRRSDTGVADVLFSESATAPTMPTGYNQKRRIGAVLFDATPDIIVFRQDGDEFIWDTPFRDYRQFSTGTAAVTRTLTVPTGLIVKAVHIATSEAPDATTAISMVTSLEQPDLAPTTSQFTLYHGVNGGGGVAARLEIRTNTSGQIRTRNSVSNVNVYSNGTTLGWIDPRGKNA